MTFFGHSMVILHQNDLQMKKWCWNDRDENTLILASFLSNDPGMTHFSHSDIIPSFRDEDEWDDVDHFPYRESCQLRPWAWSHSTLIPGSSPLFSYFRMIAEWWDGARMAGMETGMTSWETSSFRRSWSSPVIPRPSLSFQWDEDTSHSTLIPSGNDPKMRSISF